MHERLPFRDSRLAREKGGEVPCNAGILRVRQAHLRQSRAPRRARGSSVTPTFGMKPSMRMRVTSSRVNSSLIVPPTSAEPRLGIEIGAFFSFGIGEQKLFRLTASVSQRRELPGIQILALREMVREREVHIVAAEQDVIADGHARELQIAILFGYGDQRKVGRAAADIHHENDVADLDLFSESVAHLLDPGVKRRLRFFEQRHIVKPRLGGGLCREFARRRIERSGNRQDDLFGIEIALREVFQAPARCLRYRAEASTGEMRSTSAGACHGSSAPVRSTPVWLSQLFADATSRVGTFAPWVRANSPVA